MKDKLHAVFLFIKHNTLFRILFWSLLAIAVILFCLSHIPITKSMRYDMRGFIVSTDGEILEEFDFTITGKDYNFIIDPPGGEISFSGDELAVLERDAIILYFDWNSDTISKNYTSGHFTGDYHPTDDQYIYGALSFYSGATNQSHFESGTLGLEDGIFCMYADHLIDNAFIVGVSDASTDPAAVIEQYRSFVGIPELEAPEKN